MSLGDRVHVTCHMDGLLLRQVVPALAKLRRHNHFCFDCFGSPIVTCHLHLCSGLTRRPGGYFGHFRFSARYEALMRAKDKRRAILRAKDKVRAILRAKELKQGA